MQSSLRCPAGQRSAMARRVASRRVCSVRAVASATPITADEAPAAAGPRQDGIRVALKLTHTPAAGHTMGVCGSIPELGAWQQENLLRMNDNGGSVWTAEFFAEPSKPVDYKYVIINGEGVVTAWSKDPNRKLEVGSLVGSTITVSEQWEPGSREIRLTVQSAGLMDTNTLAAAGFGCVGAQGLAGNQHYAAMQSVTNQLKDISNRLESVDELKLEVAQLLAKAGTPLPSWITSKQLTELAQQLSALEDLRDVVAELAAAGTGQLKADDLVDVSEKLARFEAVEVSLSDLVSQLASRGGCPVGWAVGKQIAYAARNRIPMHNRPYRW